MKYVILTAVIAVLVAAGWYLAGWVNRWFATGPAPTDPSQPGDDDREVGADEDYGDDLAALASTERNLQSIAEELGLDLLDPDQAQDAEDILALRLSVAELVDHCEQRVNAIIDDFAPGWWEESVAVELPSFGAVHALIDDTSEFAVVTA